MSGPRSHPPTAPLPLAWLPLLLATACTPHASSTPRPPAPACPPIEVIATQLEARHGETAIEGMFKATIQTAKGRNHLDGALLAQADTGLRIELFSLIGPPVAYASITPSHADIYLPLSKNTLLETDAPDQALTSLTGGGINVEQLIGLFLGRLPPCHLEAPVLFVPDSNWFEVTCTTETQTYRLGLDPDTLLVTHLASVSSRPAVAFVCNLADYQPVGSSQLPFQIHLKAGETLQADIHFKHLDVRDTVAPDAFALPPPPGARVMPLESVIALP